jgi:predicted GNAT superfamily acetyltransferase
VTASQDDEVLAAAWTTAAASAERAGVIIRDVHDTATFAAAAALFDHVWGRDATAPTIMAPEILIANAHAGGQVSAAYDGDRIVGATAAFIGWDGTVSLHSHVTGVAPAVAGRGVGTALKWYQRAWCLERSIPRVRWTYDPLIRRNTVLNLVVLGAQVTGYLEDLYGSMPDARNVGLPTDRVEATWDLTAPRVLAAAGGRTATPDVDALRRAGAVAVLDVAADGGPVTADADAPRRLVRVPDDIETLRREDRAIASAWSEAIRATLGAALHDGWRVTGATRDGWYVLSGGDRLTELGARP